MIPGLIEEPRWLGWIRLVFSLLLLAGAFLLLVRAMMFAWRDDIWHGAGAFLAAFLVFLLGELAAPSRDEFQEDGK